jgi:hypothetical protein
MDLHLQDTAALTLASSGGLGKGAATARAREGADVVINGRTQETLEETTGLLPQASLKHDSGLGKGGRPGGNPWSVHHDADDPLPSLLSEGDGEEGRAVDDPTPSSEYPRIRSRSGLAGARPSWSGGTTLQTSSSRKRRSRSRRSPGLTRCRNRAFRSASARRTASVLLSPVIAVIWSMRRSTSGFLMLMAMVPLKKYLIPI